MIIYEKPTYQAIFTEHRVDGNGNSYIFAKCQARKLRRYCDSNLSVVDNCYQTAVKLCQSLDWPTDLLGGALPGSSAAYCWVQVPA